VAVEGANGDAGPSCAASVPTYGGDLLKKTHLQLLFYKQDGTEHK